MKSQKEPLEMFVRILLQGGKITYNNDIWVMDTEGHLCVLRRNLGTNEEVYLKVDCDLSQAKKMADKIGFVELWMQACAMTL